MSIVKQTLALLGVLLGAVGMLFCLAVIVGAWWINDPITDGLLKVFPPIEAALSFGDTTVTEFNDFVADTQTQVTQVTEEAPIISALQDKIRQVTLYVNVASVMTDSVEQVALGLVESVRPGKGETIVSRSASRLLETLDIVADTLDSALSLSQQVENGRRDKIDTLTEQLDTLQLNLTEMETAINQTENDVADIKNILPRWINIGSFIVTLIFVWFGIAQYFLFRISWQFFRRERAVWQKKQEYLEESGRSIVVMKDATEYISALSAPLLYPWLETIGIAASQLFSGASFTTSASTSASNGG
jgi:hypothetical protein